MSQAQKVRRCLARFRPCSKVLCFTGQTGEHSGDSQAFSVFTRSEAVYDMHFGPLRAVFLHQGFRKGHTLRPTGRSIPGTWRHCNTNVTMAGAWMLW